MFKKAGVLILACFLLLNIYGCLILAGAAGGTGTAMWLAGKLTQQFNATYDRTINATRSALRSLKLEVTKETKSDEVAQFKSNYYDGKEIWIDIHKVTQNATKVEVRVGGVSFDKAAAEKILNKIAYYL